MDWTTFLAVLLAVSFLEVLCLKRENWRLQRELSRRQRIECESLQARVVPLGVVEEWRWN
jgi:hypothetical protein